MTNKFLQPICDKGTSCARSLMRAGFETPPPNELDFPSHGRAASSPTVDTEAGKTIGLNLLRARWSFIAYNSCGGVHSLRAL
jgi:hypothetical protein